MLLLNFIQVTESISGSVVPLAMFNCLFSYVELCFLSDAKCLCAFNKVITLYKVEMLKRCNLSTSQCFHFS